jgi:hypothetical protein
LILGRRYLAGAGTQNAGLAIGGQYGSVAQRCTEEYNGTSWSAGGALILGKANLMGAGTQNEALGATGGTGGTEEYNGVFWSVGGTMITSLSFIGGAGTLNEGLTFGGSPPSACTQEYTKSFTIIDTYL